MLVLIILASLCIFYSSYAKASVRHLSEQERAELWRKTNSWPPTWQNETEAMKKFLDEREALIMNISFSQERWENWYSSYVTNYGYFQSTNNTEQYILHIGYNILKIAWFPSSLHTVLKLSKYQLMYMKS